ncbi:hypothetical protein BDV93DRAFT_444891, partial [Ceratobasidium sp. AG-I]
VGSCGGTNTAWENVVAIDPLLWSGGANCWRGITIAAFGKQVNAAIVDLCPTCNYGGLDMAPGLFQQFAGLEDGMFEMTWCACFPR